MKISFLYGADLPTLFRLFWRQKLRIGIRNIPSALLHLIMALFNTILSLPERFQHPTEDPEHPIFILGHWRSGTTHLHNLMTVDATFQAPNTFQAAFPHNFLFSESWLAPILDQMGPGKRLMDNMKMQMDSVQEEEIGLASLGAPSSYLAIHFPRDYQRYRSYVSFRKASQQDIESWKRAYRAYLRKLVGKLGNDKPMLLKSPANTARIPLILEMYPDARFIHIHRNPYETIRSTLHLYDAWFQMANFQSLKELKRKRDALVLDMYEEVHRCWQSDKKLIPADRLLVLGFEELKKKPIETLDKVYKFLGDGALDKQAIQAYLDTIRTYKQNTYDKLSEEVILEINERMGFVFEEFGYEKRP